MFKMKRIRYKLLFSMLTIFLLFVVIVLSIWYTTLKSEAKKTAISNMKTLINISNTNFENQVKDIISIAALTTVRSDNYLSTNIINIISRDDLTDAEIISYRQDAQYYLISLCSFKKHLNGLMLSDFSGNTVTYGIITPYQTIMNNQWLLRLGNDSSKTAFIEPHYNTKWYVNKNDLVFSILRPIYNSNDKKIGFVIADINCQLLNDSFDVDSSNECSLYLIDNQSGRIIFTPSNNLLNINEAEQLDSSFLDNLTEPSSNFYVTVNGKKMLVVYSKSSLTGWNTLNVISEDDIISNFSNSAQKIISITILLLLFMILFVFAISSLLTNNIIKLTNSVKQIGSNCSNLSFDLDIKSNDEIGALAVQFRSMMNRISQLLIEVQNREAEKRIAEISALQFQMNPHFLYNSLNTIKFLASIQGIENIQDVSEKLSSLMHTNMDGRVFLTIEDDILFNEAYMALQTYRNTNIFHYTIEADPNVLKCKIPKLIVQPLVENALKHGLSNKSVDGMIQIKYENINDNLYISIKDNGCGMSKSRINEITVTSQNSNAGHIGIHNIQERIHLYFGKQYGITVQSQIDQYTCFEITMPLIKEGDSNYA